MYLDTLEKWEKISMCKLINLKIEVFKAVILPSFACSQKDYWKLNFKHRFVTSKKYAVLESDQGFRLHSYCLN